MNLFDWFSASERELRIREDERQRCLEMFNVNCTYTGKLVAALIKSRAKYNSQQEVNHGRIEGKSGGKLYETESA